MIMKKLISGLALCSLVALQATATVPVRRILTHTQPDGTTLRVKMEGNGRYVTYATLDGLALTRGADGHYYYASRQADDLVSTGRLAHEFTGRPAKETLALAKSRLTAASAAELLDQRTPQLFTTPTIRSVASTADGLGKYKQQAPGTVSSLGSPRIPVVMVDFADRAFQDTVSTSKVSRFFNEEGYHDETGSRGSVKDYFTAQSRGLFTPTFEVVAHVKVANGYAYYGADAANGSIDNRKQTFVKDALSACEGTVDFSTFATNGKVPLVVIMFAGPGQQSSFEDGSSDYLWAHFSNATFKVNGGATTISSYFVGNELLQSYGQSENDITGAHMDGVGLFSHEFGHALGLPDFYYTGSNATIADTLRTMDYWSIMDYGQYYYDGYRPVGYTAYERSFMGWLDVKELTAEQFVTVYPYSRADEGQTAYLVRNPQNAKEYYILENRQSDTWYPKAMGTGLFITHVDYDAAAWNGNRVNNDPAHQRMAFVPADNKKDGTSGKNLFAGYKADLFPGTTGLSEFTDSTIPKMNWYTGQVSSQPLYNITETPDGLVTFSYLKANLTGIAGMQTTTPADANGTAYTLDGRRIPNLSSAAPGLYILPNGKKVMKR